MTSSRLEVAMSPSVPWFLLAHVLAALWLAAGAFAGAVVRAQTRRAGSLAERVFGLRLAWRLLAGFTIPGAAVAGVLGVHLVQARGIGWQEGWVHASLGLWALALLLSVLVLAPRVKRTLGAAEASLEAGLPSEELKRLLAARWPGYVADFNALSVVVLTLLMVLQPF